jgi:hypothetical protein
VAGSCEYGDEPAGSGATESVSSLYDDRVSSSDYIPMASIDRMING